MVKNWKKILPLVMIPLIIAGCFICVSAYDDTPPEDGVSPYNNYYTDSLETPYVNANSLPVNYYSNGNWCYIPSPTNNGIGVYETVKTNFRFSVIGDASNSLNLGSIPKAWWYGYTEENQWAYHLHGALIVIPKNGTDQQLYYYTSAKADWFQMKDCYIWFKFYHDAPSEWEMQIWVGCNVNNTFSGFIWFANGDGAQDDNTVLNITLKKLQVVQNDVIRKEVTNPNNIWEIQAYAFGFNTGVRNYYVESNQDYMPSTSKAQDFKFIRTTQTITNEYAYSEGVGEGYSQGYTTGYNAGWNEAVSGEQSGWNIGTVIITLYDYGLDLFRSFLDFDLLGFNLYEAFLGIASIAIFIWIAKRII